MGEHEHSCECGHAHEHEQHAETGVAQTGVIDLYGFDTQRQQVVLVMNEARTWDATDDRLFQLQEKFNAYASFLLDGELAETHPDLADKPARIELRSQFMPDERALDLLNTIHDQLELQNICLEVVVAEGGSCGDACDCGHGH
jgi:hypothetical protein